MLIRHNVLPSTDRELSQNVFPEAVSKTFRTKLWPTIGSWPTFGLLALMQYANTTTAN